MSRDIPEHDPIDEFHRMAGSRWKLRVFGALMGGPMRFGELKRSLRGISPKVLTAVLRELENDDIIYRKVYFENVTKVEYYLTEKGFLLLSVVKEILSCMNDVEAYQKARQAPAIGTVPDARGRDASYRERLERARAMVAQADYVLIGIGQHFNTAYGLGEYRQDVVERLFPHIAEVPRLRNAACLNDVINAYDKINLQNETTYWTLWSKILWLYCFADFSPKQYDPIRKLVRGKPYLITTTTPDTRPLRSGFDPSRLYYPLGSYMWLQCDLSCTNQVWPAEDHLIPLLHDLDRLGRINGAQIPRCPYCGEHLVPNRYRCTHSLNVTPESLTSPRRYEEFLAEVGDGRIVLIEIGTSLHMPYIIRYRFENYVSSHRNAGLIRICKQEYHMRYAQIMPSSVTFSEDISSVLADLTEGH